MIGITVTLPGFSENEEIEKDALFLAWQNARSTGWRRNVLLVFTI